MSDQNYNRDYKSLVNSRWQMQPSHKSHLLHSGLYSSKDGEDIVMKTLGVTKNFFVLGVIIGMINMKTKIIATQRRTYMRFIMAGVVPTMMYGAFFTVATQCIGRWRGKDGAVNHFFGGIATAPLLAVLWKMPATSILPNLLLISAVGAYIKSVKSRGAYVLGNPYYWSPWKTTKERPRNNLVNE